MARTKEFDPEAALDTAMRVFWRDGYDGTSTADLVDEIGIARASLYGTFGSKRDLYLASLDRFISGHVVPAPADVLASTDSALDAIKILLSAGVDAAEDAPAGCFAVNATTEHGDRDEDISRRLELNRSRLESALYEALVRARANGELAAHVEPRQAARMLLTLNTGLKVLERAGSGQVERCRDAIAAAVSMLAA